MAVIALGFFDGAHLGHQALFRKARKAAAQRSVPAAAATFDRHPGQFITNTPTPLINTNEDREYLIRDLYGMDRVHFITFDSATMQMPWERFVEEICVERFGATHLICGENFTFGYKGEGTAYMLMKKCTSMGIGCDIIPSVQLGGDTVSSTRIRALLEKGEMEQAAELLGHPHILSGEVVHGKGLGAKLFCPTANVDVPDTLVKLPAGGYETVAIIDGARYPAITNIGRSPTVSMEEKTTAETHVIGFEGDLYGRTLRLEILRFIRPEIKFDSMDALREQILSDVEDIRRKYEGKSL